MGVMASKENDRKEMQRKEQELQRIAAMQERLNTEERERQEKHAAEKETLSQQQQKLTALSREKNTKRQQEQREWWERHQEKKGEERERIKKTEERKQEEQQKQQKREQKEKEQKEYMQKIHEVAQERHTAEGKRMAAHVTEGDERKIQEHMKAHVALVEQTHQMETSRAKEEALRRRTEIQKDNAHRLHLMETNARTYIQKEEKKCADIEMECRKLPLSLARQTIGRARAELEHVRQKEKEIMDRERKIIEEEMRRSITTAKKKLDMRLKQLEEIKKRAIVASADQERGKIAELEQRKTEANRQADLRSKICGNTATLEKGRGGGIGRRASLRSWWEQSHRGSSPLLGTIRLASLSHGLRPMAPDHFYCHPSFSSPSSGEGEYPG